MRLRPLASLPAVARIFLLFVPHAVLFLLLLTSDVAWSEPTANDRATTPCWPEGATVKGRVVDHRGVAVANAEVLLLGDGRIIVDAPDKRPHNISRWLVTDRAKPAPPSTHTNSNGEFSLERKIGTANRLAVIADDPLFWEVKYADLPQKEYVEIKLPASGSLSIHVDVPVKKGALNEQSAEIDLRSLDGVDWDVDLFRFHSNASPLTNPGDTVFEHLPPARFSVERVVMVPTTGNSRLMTSRDRQLVTVASDQQTTVEFDRRSGRPLNGHVSGLEDVDLRYAHLMIQHWGPEEQLGPNGKPNHMATTFDVVPIDSQGNFTTDPIPPGKYWAQLSAVRTDSPSQSQADFTGYQEFTIPDSGEMPQIEVVAKPVERPKSAAVQHDPALQIVDEQGKPIPKVEVMVHSSSGGGRVWFSDKGANVLFQGELPPIFDVIVRADGYASAIRRFAGDDREKMLHGKATMTVSPGEKTLLRFALPEGLHWPEGLLPEIYFQQCADQTRMMRHPANRKNALQINQASLDFNMLNVHPEKPGEFSFQLAPDTPPFFVGVHAPDFLQSFDAGPFTAKDVQNGVLTVPLPKPATLEISFDPGSGDPAARPYHSTVLSVYKKIPGTSHINVLMDQEVHLDVEPLVLDDLPPAEYLVTLRTQTNAPYTPAADPAHFSERKKIDLQAGQTEKVNFQYVPLNRDAFRGNRTANVRIETVDGKPAVGRHAEITYYDGHYGELSVFSGDVPESGEITLKDITDVVPPVPDLEQPYNVKLSALQSLGRFAFSKPDVVETLTFRVPPEAGDMAPDVDIQNITAGSKLKLSDLRGKVVLLDFWATWCGPCQPAIEKLDKEMAENADQWKNRFVVIPLSIDDDPTTPQQHLASHGWTHLNTYWTGENEKTGWHSPAMRAFVLNSVPTSILIDRDGKILWVGHPMSDGGKDLENRIETAIHQ